MSRLPLGRVVSVRAGRVAPRERPEWDQVRSEWRTAFWKSELAGPVAVGPLGLEGDEQADLRHHGGPERAVLMAARTHYEKWSTFDGLEAMGPGGFGENLTVDGFDENNVCVGDVLELDGLTLQVSSPRAPCADISRRWNAEWLLKQVLAQRTTGWYLRVLRPGRMHTGETVRVVERPHPGWTVDRLLRVRFEPPRAANELATAAGLAALAPEWREKFAALPPRDDR